LLYFNHICLRVWVVLHLNWVILIWNLGNLRDR
jgi:hypothetical protein